MKPKAWPKSAKTNWRLITPPRTSSQRHPGRSASSSVAWEMSSRFMACLASLSMGSACRKDAAAHLVALDRLEQRLEVAFAEAFAVVAHPLDELEEHRTAKGRLREDLQQQARRSAFGGSVEQDASRLQFGDRLAMAGQPRLKHLVVDVVGRGHQRHAGQPELVDGVEQVVAQERDVLDALAVELHQVLLDLAGALLRLLVQRNTDLAVR